MTPKEQLIKAINSHIAAQISGDPGLQEYAAGNLGAFLDERDDMLSPKPGDAAGDGAE